MVNSTNNFAQQLLDFLVFDEWFAGFISSEPVRQDVWEFVERFSGDMPLCRQNRIALAFQSSPIA